MAGVQGFEPWDGGIRIRCLTTWRYPNVYFFSFVVAGVAGFEPAHTGIKTLGLTA